LAGGGAFFDWGEYDLSFLLGVLGDRPQLQSLRGFHTSGLRSETIAGGPITVEQHGAALLEFDGGLTLYYERGGGVHGDMPATVRLHGTTGSLFFSYYPWDPNELLFYHEGTNGAVISETLPVPMEPRWKNANTALIAHFIDCIEGAAVPLMPICLARKHLEIITAILAD
jgi:predicted dehydrogenase